MKTMTTRDVVVKVIRSKKAGAKFTRSAVVEQVQRRCNAPESTILREISYAQKSGLCTRVDRATGKMQRC